MNANAFSQKDYENKTAFRPPKNKPNSNPISSKAKMSANAFSQKDYENKPAFRLKKKQTQTNPISNAHKPIKGAGRKKGIRNFFRVSVAGKDII